MFYLYSFFNYKQVHKVFKTLFNLYYAYYDIQIGISNTELRTLLYLNKLNSLLFYVNN